MSYFLKWRLSNQMSGNFWREGLVPVEIRKNYITDTSKSKSEIIIGARVEEYLSCPLRLKNSI